jgi:hypothetical protein
MLSHLAVLALMLPVPAQAAEPNLQLQEFMSRPFRFSVQMPGRPTQAEQNVPTAVGDVKMTRFTVEISQKLAYMVAVADYPAGSANANNQDAILDGAANGAATSLRGRINTKEPITLNGRHPGRHIEVDVPGLGVYRSHLYLVGDRLYQLVIVGSRADVTSRIANQFLASLRLQ